MSSFIVIIDDDESMCLALSRLLQVAGYEARSYFSAESFLGDPDHGGARLVVADIQLRGMAGFDLQRVHGVCELRGTPVPAAQHGAHASG
ncbi:MAG: response regulator [Steroidobacteraceae bacterium]